MFFVPIYNYLDTFSLPSGRRARLRVQARGLLMAQNGARSRPGGSSRIGTAAGLGRDDRLSCRILKSEGTANFNHSHALSHRYG